MGRIKEVDGNIIHVDFTHTKAPLGNIAHLSATKAPIIELPVRQHEEIEEPIPEELLKITTFLRDNYPRDYGEIGRQISQSYDYDTPGHIILQEVLATLESDNPLLFRRVSKILT